MMIDCISLLVHTELEGYLSLRERGHNESTVTCRL